MLVFSFSKNLRDAIKILWSFGQVIQEHPAGERPLFYLFIGRNLDDPMALCFLGPFQEDPKLHRFLDRAPPPSQRKINEKKIFSIHEVRHQHMPYVPETPPRQTPPTCSASILMSCSWPRPWDQAVCGTSRLPTE